MDCSLWFGRCMVNSASEIAEHFDMASLRGYFLGGSLEEWLREHGGEEQADRVSALDPKDPALDRRLAEIFGQADAEKNEVFRGDGAGYAAPAVSGSGWNRGSYSVVPARQGTAPILLAAPTLWGMAPMALRSAASADSDCGNGSGNGASAPLQAPSGIPRGGAALLPEVPSSAAHSDSAP